MATKKNEVAKAEDTNGALALVSEERPSWMTTDTARGSEDVGMDDIILPRIDVLQAISPQVKRNDPKRIEDAEQGMLFNTVSGELYGDAVNFVPVKFAREFIVWQDRDSGGGFRGAFPTEGEAERERLALENPDLHEVVETHVHYILLVRDDGTTEEAVLSLAKSKRKASRHLNTLVQMAGGDRFSKMYSLQAVEANGPKGDYWTVTMKPLGFVNQAIYEKGKATYEAIMAGERKVDRTADESDAEGSVGGPEI